MSALHIVDFLFVWTITHNSGGLLLVVVSPTPQGFLQEARLHVSDRLCDMTVSCKLTLLLAAYQLSAEVPPSKTLPSGGRGSFHPDNNHPGSLGAL